MRWCVSQCLREALVGPLILMKMVCCFFRSYPTLTLGTGHVSVRREPMSALPSGIIITEDASTDGGHCSFKRGCEYLSVHTCAHQPCPGQAIQQARQFLIGSVASPRMHEGGCVRGSARERRTGRWLCLWLWVCAMVAIRRVTAQSLQIRYPYLGWSACACKYMVM